MPLNPVRRVLSNGATLIVQENHASPAVSLLAAVAAGGYDDQPGREGTATLLARTLDRGTSAHTAAQIADELDGRGVSLSVSAGRHQVALAATALAEDIPAVLAMLAGMLRDPVFPEREVTTRRAEQMTAIRQEEDDPASVAHDRLVRELYAGHPYSRRVQGTVESMAAIGRDDIVGFHRAHVDPAALTVVATGSLASEAMVAGLEAVFSAWESRSRPSRAPVPDAAVSLARRRLDIAMPDKAQSDVAYGFVGIRRSDPAYMAAAVMNNVLGQYALGGRLGDSIRERQGMAYYVFSTLDAGIGPGPLTIRAGVAAGNVDRTIASIDHELDVIRAEGVSDQEVADAKQYLAGALPRQLETNAGIASFLLTAERFGLGLDFDRRLPDLIRGVSRQAAIEAGRRLLDSSRATIVVAGPGAPGAPGTALD